jgi:hypothetical protein
MAKTDVNRDASKRQDGQESFEGGMNWIDAPNELQANESRFLLNTDIRRKDLEKAKGQRAFSDVEIGAEFYDKFFTADVDPDKFQGFNALDSSIAVNDDFKLAISGPTSGNAWGTVGVVSKREQPNVELAYIEFELTTPAALSSLTRFRLALGPADNALSTDDGLQLEFDESGDIIEREDAAETDTTVNWALSTTYRIRIEKDTAGYTSSMTNLTTADQVATSLFTTTYEGNLPSFAEFQVYGGDWLIDNVVYQPGFGEGVARAPANGIFRYYREEVQNQTIVFAYGRMYRYTDEDGFIIIAEGYDLDARWTARVFNDELICTNGVDRPLIYNGASISQLGSGLTAAPVAPYIEVHLQSIFLLKNNSLYRNTVGNINEWDELDPNEEVDAWNGDTGVGMVKLGSSIYIIKSASVWEVSGTSNSNFVVRRIPGTRGCVAPYSIASNGQFAFWRGPDGVYRFDGLRTTLVSYRIHPAFNKNVHSPFSTTVFSKAEDSVGVIHDYKYRLAVTQHAEPDIEYNNYEYVLDFLTNNGQGGWYARDRRNVLMYSSWDGKDDDNELLMVPSDTSNVLFELEVEDGNTTGLYTDVTITRVANTPFVGKWQSRNLIGRGSVRDYLEKTWSPLRVLYTAQGDWHVGVKLSTDNNIVGELVTFAQSIRKNDGTFQRTLGTSFYLDSETSILPSGFMEDIYEKYPKNQVAAVQDVSARFGSANVGVECILSITQGQEVRTASGETGTGLRAQPGNYEPFRITRVLIGIQEENH